MADLDMHIDMIAAAMAEQAKHLDALVAEVGSLRADNATLRDLLAKALPWVDPNESDDGHLLEVLFLAGEAVADDPDDDEMEALVLVEALATLVEERDREQA